MITEFLNQTEGEPSEEVKEPVAEEAGEEEEGLE